MLIQSLPLFFHGSVDLGCLLYNMFGLLRLRINLGRRGCGPFAIFQG